MKFIIWGLPLHSHTHSYVHHAFARTSKYMGFETHWVPNDESSNSIIDKNSIIISCGVADNNLKKFDGAKYVLHNSNREDLKTQNYINLQVYTHDVLGRDIEKINNELTFWEEKTKTLYQPWATDLLPNEIESIEPILHNTTNSKINWVGSVTEGEHGNIHQLNEYYRFCKENKIDFLLNRLTSIEENITLIRDSRQAPVIQGQWQVDKGYIPCRVFKNISYGCWAVTNSSTTSKLLGLKECNNIEEMFIEGESFLTKGNTSLIKEKMNLVSNKHTYVNRINNIISCLKNNV